MVGFSFLLRFEIGFQEALYSFIHNYEAGPLILLNRTVCEHIEITVSLCGSQQRICVDADFPTMFSLGRGLYRRVLGDLHSREALQETLLQTQTLSREVDQPPV